MNDRLKEKYKYINSRLLSKVLTPEELKKLGKRDPDKFYLNRNNKIESVKLSVYNNSYYKDYLKKYYINNIDYFKKRYLDNREYYKKYNHDYYLNKKNKIKELNDKLKELQLKK